MQQIECYYTDNLKYLKLGDYIRYFEGNESIDDMLACIKNQETPVKIRTTKEYLIRHKLSDKSRVIYSYDEIWEEIIFDYSSVEYDRGSDVAYALYDVVNNQKWRDILGEKICFCRNRELQLYLAREKKEGVFLYDDLEELKNGLLKEGKIPDNLVIKMNCTDKEIKDNDLLDKSIINNVV